MSAFHHVPVLLDEVLKALAAPLGQDSGSAARVFVDVTLGGAGHTAAVAKAFALPHVIGFDRDADALAAARVALAEFPGRLDLVHAPFDQLTAQLERLDIGQVDAVLADIGVSSHQLDTPARGFSFQKHGPLDMRMDPSRGRPAHEMIADADEATLARVLFDYGEESDARRIARAMVEQQPTTTDELARLVGHAMSHRQRRQIGARIHPATRTFQALRIWVNAELDQLAALLEQAPERLGVGGRLAIISFHSLEDRMVKRRFKALSTPPPLPRGLPVRDEDRPRPRFSIPRGHANGQQAGDEEVARNPRARSARLRVLQRELP